MVLGVGSFKGLTSGSVFGSGVGFKGLDGDLD
jgi:hypothetical protein